MQSTKNNKNKKKDSILLKRLLSFTRPYKGRLILSVISTIILALMAPLRPYLIQLSVDKYIANELVKGLIYITLIQIGILLLETVFRFVFMYITNWLGQNVVDDIRKAVFKKVIHQDLKYYDHNAIGTLTTRTINDIEAINNVFSEGLISIVADVLTILAILAVMFYTNWKLALVCIAILPVLFFATYIFKENVKKSFQMVRTAVAKLNAFVQEHISGMYIIQTLAAEEKELEKFTVINKDHRKAHIKSIFAYSVFFPVVEIIMSIALGILVWYGAARMLDGEISQGVIIAFILYLNMLFRPMRMLADKFNTLQMGIVAADRVFTVLDSESYLKNNGKLEPEKIEGSVTFKNVYFSYNPGKPVLKNINFNLKPSEALALVGPTGAGKSSIINILTRLYEIDSGSISIDAVNIKDYDIYALRSKVGVVLQDVFLFSGSIYDNITLFNNEMPLERVKNICKEIGIHKFIMELPDDYDFNVRERGGTLSQGQRQLISFARVLLYNPSILVLDEATSSVDTESEILIQKAIEKLIIGRTSIVIAHRLSTIKKAKKILVLRKGEIVEEGTHASLLNIENGVYRGMYLTAEKKESEIQNTSSEKQ
ncbi:MAG TPA: ABC transporter ATP-binding protein [Chitinophagaceae bacterium]|nr:ABC transporter ATP-binding protein [Chitinophagaceae bacterium]